MTLTDSVYISKIEDIKYLKSLMLDATKVYNQTLYFLRQNYFENRKNSTTIYLSGKELEDRLKQTDSYKNSILDYNVKQYARTSATDSVSSFFKSLKRYNINKTNYTGTPKLPKYKKRDVCTTLCIDSSRLRKKGCQDNEIRLPKSHFKFKTRIQLELIKCVRIKYVHEKVKIEIVYEKTNDNSNTLNADSYCGIDLGVGNLASMTFNDINKSFILNGGPLKSINQFYNKQKSKIQSELKITTDRNWSSRLSKLQLKRNSKVDDYLHKASKMIVDILLENKVGNVVIGKNEGWKQEIGIGKRNNQNFVLIPHARFIEMISYKCKNEGINVIITEESYTSKIDHLSNEKLCKHETYSGKRLKRGLFKSSSGKILNADINGAIGILRKIKAISDIQLLNLGYRGDVVSPIKLEIN